MFKFVDDALARGSVLVHCLAGAHRAGAMGALLLMRHSNLDVPSAIETAKSLRPIIDPHFSSRLPKFLDRCKRTYGKEWAEAARSAKK
jgi:protein-tyrosine phosphatase